MIPTLLRRPGARFGIDAVDDSNDADDSDADADDDGARFIPSVLDASVRSAHGESDDGRREIADVQEEGRKLEDARRDS
jgi:hypothetical protein